MHPTFDTAFYIILNAIGYICERTHKPGWVGFFLVWDWVVKDVFCYVRKVQLNPPFSMIYFKGKMLIKTFPVSVMVPNATMVVYGILFGGMHLIGKKDIFI